MSLDGKVLDQAVRRGRNPVKIERAVCEKSFESSSIEVKDSSDVSRARNNREPNRVRFLANPASASLCRSHTRGSLKRVLFE